MSYILKQAGIVGKHCTVCMQCVLAVDVCMQCVLAVDVCMDGTYITVILGRWNRPNRANS